MSPGSRNAPLTISFARHDNIKKWVIPDERSAGFVAVGIAQTTKSPVVLCCTSGSALLNYAPAIAEAYYREIPLIILSADRPPELIDQRDGQTIRQYEALKNHVKASYNLPVVLNEAAASDYQNQLVNGIKQSMQLPSGPIHINIPFQEPFYPTTDQKLEYSPIDIEKYAPGFVGASIDKDISLYKRILILVGQQDPDTELDQVLEKLADKVPIIKSPLNNLTVGIEHVDGFINDQDELKPDLLITSGLSVLSKKLKNYLRKHTPEKHLHLDPAGVEVDTYLTHPEYIKQPLSRFLENLSFDHVDDRYIQKWKSFESETKLVIDAFPAGSFSETAATRKVLEAIPANINLHLSNSMPVRYADLFGVKNGINCFSNRGTSGIDGCTSTAVGTSLVSDQMNVLITGDLAFQYDRNAFFHNYDLPNLRIIVLNNQGGGIFRLIDGPSRLPELEEYFETRHNRTAEYICAENGFEYFTAKDEPSLLKHLETFFNNSKSAKVLEIFTSPEINQKVYKELKKHIHERINN